MTADKPTPVVPNLRFPEFRSAGDWHFQHLSDIAEPISERVGTSNCVPMSVTTGVGLLSQEEKFGRTIAGSSYKNYIRLQTNDFAYNKSATKEFPQGYIARYSGTRDAAVPNSIFTCFRPDAAAIIPEYLDHLFHGNHHGRWLRKYITVGARAHGALSVSDDDLMSMPVPLPPAAVSCPEQQKIADCLGSLDDLIAAEGRKLEALGQHKQGLMQQIFPLPRETLPRLRFPEFRDAAEWSLSTLQQLLKIPATYGIVKAGEYLTTGVPMVRGGDIKDGKVSVDLPLVAPEIHEQFKRTRLLRNDVVIALVGYPGEAAVIPDALVGANVSRAVGVLRVAPSLNPNYLAAYLNSPSGRKSFLKSSAGSAQIVVNLSDLNALQLPMPEIDEQERIACCVDALNAHFGAQSLKLDALKQHKQGLLQQIFPSLEAK